ncbi:MAG: DNA translocase FtsK 4TM domain-containing protein, partial [Bryobacteraceae bacterium]
MVSYHPADPSWNTATGERARNLIGPAGSHLADLLLQLLGAWAFPLPALLVVAAYQMVLSRRPVLPVARLAGFLLLLAAGTAAFALGPEWRVFGIPAGGLLGLVLAELLRSWFNTTGAAIVIAAAAISSLYMVSGFSFFSLAPATRRFGSWWRGLRLPRRPSRKRPERAIERGAAPVPVSAPPEAKEPTEPSPAREIPIRTLEDLPPPPPESSGETDSETLPEPEPQAPSGLA